MLKIRNRFVLTGVLALVLSLGACGDDDDNGVVDPGTPGTVPNQVTIPIPEGASDLGDEAFGENPREIPMGTEVTWINEDSVPHTITSDADEFDSGEVAPGQSFVHVFSTEGDFPYGSTLEGDEGMFGRIVVTDDDADPSPSPSPSPSPEPSPSPSPSPEPTESPEPTTSPFPTLIPFPTSFPLPTP